MKKKITLILALAFAGFAQAQIPHISQLKDINPSGASDGGTRNFTTCNGKLYFVADDGVHGGELWVTDSTEAGTMMVKDINPGSTGSYPNYMVAMNNKVYFNCYDGTHGSELWVSDGTAAGTMLVKDIWVGDNSTDAYPAPLVVLNNKIYFSANDNDHAIEPWVSDGTAAGTFMLGDINHEPSYGNSFADYFTPYNNKMYFQADDYDHGLELWVTDGTTGGTMMVKDINNYASGWGSDPMEFAEYHGRLYFKADVGNNINQGQLWSTDGTAAGTMLVDDPYPTGNANISHLHVFGDTLYFMSNDGVHGYELWKSDGTAAGTALKKDINPGTGGSYGEAFTNFNGKFYFSADDGTNGNDLWVSDGTEAGTMLFKDINENSGDSYPNGFCVFGQYMYFEAYGGSTYNHTQLWRTNGTPSGTVVMAPVGGQDDALYCNNGPFGILKTSIYFGADYSTFDCEVWKLDTLTAVAGISELTTTESVTVYPNPGTGLFKVKLSDYNNISVEVYNNVGQLIYSEAKVNEMTAIDLSNFNNGIYFMKTLRNNEMISQTKLVKTNQ